MKPLHIFKSFVAYCGALNVTCPKQRTYERMASFNKEQHTTNVKIMVRDVKLDPSSLT
jgi:hypothetical protein